MGRELTPTGLRQMSTPAGDVKGTAGSVSFPLDEVVRTSAAYRWTLNHTLPVEDAGELFPTHLTEAGA